MPANKPKRMRFGRDVSEFDRALAFFDATFAVALTLLVTTLDVSAGDRSIWRNLSSLNDAVGSQLVPFAISFVVISVFWYGHHRFASRLVAIDGGIIVGSLALVATIVLLPFSTEAIGDPNTADMPLPTAVYAINIAGASIMTTMLYLLAVRRDLLQVRPAPATVRYRLTSDAAPAAVFLASIPVAYAFSPLVAELSWLSLIPIGAVLGNRADQADQAEEDAAAGTSEGDAPSA